MSMAGVDTRTEFLDRLLRYARITAAREAGIMPFRPRPLAAALVVALVLPALAGCSIGAFTGTSATTSPSPTKTSSTGGSATPSDDPGAGGTGRVTNPDGSLQVCNALSVSTVKSVTGLKLVESHEGDPDTPPGAGFTSYSCIYFGADPATSVVVFVYAGDPDQVFQTNSDGIKPTFGWGPIDGVGDRAEGDGIHVLDVLWGSRYVISVVDNTDGSDVGVKNMAALATAVHKAIGE
jgi:hypothetical protein